MQIRPDAQSVARREADETHSEIVARLKFSIFKYPQFITQGGSGIFP